MSKTLATLTLGLLLCAPGWAQDEPVLRVQSISPVANSSPSKLLHQRPTDKQPFVVSPNSTGYVRDHYITDANTVAALEFLIGGRVGINKATDITIVNERSVADGKTPVKRVILKGGSLWINADAKSLKQPLEIQTNGGVMGIKGTEFTVETQSDGSSKVSCFESNSSIGGVEIRDNSGKLIGVAKPGDEYVLNLKGAPVVKHYENIEEFRQKSITQGWSDFQNTPTGRIVVPIGTAVVYAVGGGRFLSMANGAAYTYDSFSNVENDPAGASLAALSLANQAGANTGPVGGYLGWGASVYSSSKSSEPAKPEYPSNLSPDSSPKSNTAKTSGSFPSFSWQPVEDARSYAVMVSSDENLNDILFMDQTQNLQMTYPSTMRPLPKGKYFWRVVPLDEEDKPVKKAAQTYFMVQ